MWDLETVCEIAREYIRGAGLDDRVSVRPGDMLREPFPRGHDVILLSQILHDWSPDRGLELLREAHAALPVGGRVLIHEKLVDDDGAGPLANALVNIDMLVWTEGQQYDEAMLRDLLSRAGFVGLERRRTQGYWSVVVGRK